MSKPARLTPPRSTGLPEAATAVALLAQLGLFRLLMRADETCVYVVGIPWRTVCAARVRFGMPCPTCGATRSFVLALHGHFGLAWRLFPAGPLVVAGLLMLACALVGLAWFLRRGEWARAEGLGRVLIAIGAAYSGATALLWITDWVLRCRRG